MLREEVEKFFTSLEKTIVEEVVDDNISKTSAWHTYSQLDACHYFFKVIMADNLLKNFCWCQSLKIIIY
jgi:hypothetical protein